MSLRFRRLAVALVVIVAAVGATGVSLAATAATTPRAVARPNAALGERLVRLFWRELKQHNLAALDKLLAEPFQYEVKNLRYTKSQYLRNLPTVVRYRLGNFRITFDRRIIVATYRVSGKQIVRGQPYVFRNIGRMSMFMRHNGRWGLVAHANFGLR